jgi:hypothetical protein
MHKLSKTLERMLRSFDNDPPSTDYQRGYKRALEDLKREASR